MSRERKQAERLARKREYRANRGAKVICSGSVSSDEEIQKATVRLAKQLEVMPGAPEHKYMVFLLCGEDGCYTYPIFGCPDGFTADMQDAIKKHQDMNRPEIQGGFVKSIGDALFRPPDAMVQMMAMGVNVLVTNRLDNRPSDDPTLRGQFGQGGGGL